MSQESLQVKKRNGRLQQLDINKVNLCAQRACENIKKFRLSRGSGPCNSVGERWIRRGVGRSDRKFVCHHCAGLFVEGLQEDDNPAPWGYVGNDPRLLTYDELQKLDKERQHDNTDA